jgi:Lipid A 3-O-deacylase (PagL)
MNIRNLALLTFLCLPYPTASLGQDSTGHTSDRSFLVSKSDDLDNSIYYTNKLEFSLETGWLPINIPFVFDCFVGDSYNETPLQYTLAPILASLRWQMGDVRGPSILRGNFDLSFSGAFTLIPRGPETHYWAYDMGIRRNFVRRNWRTAPYFDIRLGVGRIDAKGPKGVEWAQGQDLTFTFMMGSGVRYNFNSRYAISVGMNYMHVSNLYLSEPKFLNYGINVYGPMAGLDMRLGKPKGRAPR